MAVEEQTIAWYAQSELPITWDALSKDARFGEGRLLAKVDLAKDSVLGEVVLPAAETVRYSRRVRAYVGKVAAIEIITAAIDFWMDKSLTITIDSPRETKTYESRIKTLQQQKADMLAATRRDAAIIADEITYTRPTVAGVPGLSTINDDLLTPSPQLFPPPFNAA